MSFATVYWLDVLAESIDYCRAKKGMELYFLVLCQVTYILYLDLQTSSPMELLRDFKKHTAKKVIEAIENNPQESRKEWLLWMMKRAGKKQGNITNYQFWQHNNKPIELWSTEVIKQKIDYIHSNPIESGFVTNPVDWKYSSARNFQGDHTILQIDETGFL